MAEITALKRKMKSLKFNKWWLHLSQVQWLAGEFRGRYSSWKIRQASYFGGGGLHAAFICKGCTFLQKLQSLWKFVNATLLTWFAKIRLDLEYHQIKLNIMSQQIVYKRQVEKNYDNFRHILTELNYSGHTAFDLYVTKMKGFCMYISIWRICAPLW